MLATLVKRISTYSFHLEMNESLSLCTYHCHAPPTPGRAEVGISRDLQ